MAQLSDIRNLLQRDGTSRAQRALPALDPGFVKVDEREVEDFLVFALRFARQVNDYDRENQIAGDWTPFFACDTSVLIASIEKTNPLPIKQAVAAERAAVPTAESLANLFTLLIDIAAQMEAWRTGLASWSGLKDKITKLIRANLSTTLSRLVGFEKGAANHLDSYEEVGTDRYGGFGAVWNLSDPGAVMPDTGLFGSRGTEDAQIQAAKETLGEQFTALYNVLLEIIGLAASYFEDSVTDQPDHEPHLALFIAFLKLYLQVRDDANRLTERHLDFYYKDVLQLKSKDAVPDSVHVFFQLARQREAYKIDAGTALDAGKDATGVKRIYTLDHDLVATTAQIDSFRTVFVEYDKSSEDFPDTKPIERVYAAPVANSQDGLGAELEDTEKPSWKTLGSMTMPPATLGFAIASRALLLAEGTRTITLGLHCDNLPGALAEDALNDAFSVAFSGEKAWIELESVTVTITLEDESTETGRGVLRLTVVLQPTDEPIAVSDAKALGEAYGTTLPLARVLLRQPEDEATAYAYQTLKSLVLRSISLAADVDGVHAVIVENDLFAMDVGKPFQPFGPLPGVGANFYMGSAEVFGKKLTALDLVIAWDALPETFGAHYEGYHDPSSPPATPEYRVDVSLLQDAVWQPITASEALFEEEEGSLTMSQTLSLTASDLSSQEPRVLNTLKPRSTDTRHGFLRLTLTPESFGHNDYAGVLTRQALAAGKLPNEMVGAHYRLSTYTFTVLDAEGSYLFFSTTTTYSDEAAARDGYATVLTAAADDTHYDLLDDVDGEGGLGFRLLGDDNEVLATHPDVYASEEERADAIASIIGAVSEDTVHAAIRQAIVLGTTNNANAAPANSEVIIPNEPYTPTIKSFRVDYEALLVSEEYPDEITFIHILPFGYERIDIPTDATIAKAEVEDEVVVTKPFLLPQFDDEGTLYLGLKKLEPLQSLSVLFQVAESTADTDLEKANVAWSYLADNAWVPFEDYEITADTTQALIASGIVTFSIPRAITSTNTRLPATNADGDALHWIKAAVPINAGAVSELINAHTQAVKATFADNSNDPDHLTTPLEAETIGGLVKADAALDSITQQYNSFGGQPAEEGIAFYIRVSERLRHKGRAITLFDYERLVLEHYPDIYKVKCINHSNDQHILAPGHVLIAVIPDFTKLKAVDRRAPKVTFDTLDDIKTFLGSINCPFVRSEGVAGNTLHVLNPLYEEIQVAFKVKFKPEVTAVGFYKRELNAAIIRFLSPWAFEEGSEINFGGKVYKSSILNFVEEQDYVAYVADFRMMHDGATEDVDEIEAGTPRSILIPVDDHEIEAITGDYCAVEHALSHQGIGHMTVDEDFVID